PHLPPPTPSPFPTRRSSDLDVVSTREVGTTITLYLPLVDGRERKERAPAVPHGSARILIVDDEPVQLRTGRRVLVRLGYEVEVIDRKSTRLNSSHLGISYAV